MIVRVLYFARLRELLGMATEEIALPAGVADVAALRLWLAARGEAWQQALNEDRQIRVALNQEIVPPTASLAEGDEVAFFPPVTGG